MNKRKTKKANKKLRNYTAKMAELLSRPCSFFSRLLKSKEAELSSGTFIGVPIIYNEDKEGWYGEE